MSTQTRRRPGPSIVDVARLAGVSAQTVSRVSTGSTSVRPETRARVLAAMDQLGYSPNRAARALRNGSFGTIGLIAHRFGRTGEARTTEAVVEAAEEHGYAVTLLNVRNPEQAVWEDAAYRLTHQAIDALIIIRAEGVLPTSLAFPAGMPVAVSDSRLAGYYPAVVCDQVQGSRDAVRHLLDLGHAVVHHIAGPHGSDPATFRAASWERTLQEAGIAVPEMWRGDWTAESGYRIGKEVAEHPEVTAVYCANDEMAFGLMRALHEHGRRVPQDVSVVGFDDIALSEYSAPPLTTVRQDFHAMGYGLVSLLLEQIKAGGMKPRSRVVIPTELHVRGSSGPPPGR